MKRFLFLCIVPFLTFGCSVVSESTSSSTDSSSYSSTSGTSTTTTTTDSATLTEDSFDYGTTSLYEISNSEDSLTESVTITGLSTDNTIYLLKTNPNSSSISSSYTRKVASATNVDLDSGDFSSSSSSSSSGTSSGPSSFPGKRSSVDSCLTLSLNESLPPTDSSSRASSYATVETVDYEVGDTKSIYVDTSLSSYTFESQTATLRAKGTYCYIWVVGDTDDDTYWTDSTSLSDDGLQVNEEIVEAFAENFDNIYPMVRTVFGNESDKLFVGSTYNICDMDDYSDTGTMVNIVIYDINSDTTSGSTVGYFYARDFYSNFTSSVFPTSNCGKYFYVDAWFSANDTETVYSTLAHEFQHMINYSQKTIASYERRNAGTSSTILSSGTFYNEMLSMLSEDMMKEYLMEVNSDFTDDDAPTARLPMFNRRYYEVGLEWNSSGNYCYYSYSNNYAFGAWLMRNYGGVDLLNKLSTNSYVDIDSIEDASGASIEDLLKNYGVACLVDEDDTGFNISLSQSDYSCNGYSYPIDALDLWELSDVLTSLYSTYKSNKTSYSAYYAFDGPQCFGYNEQETLRPYGFQLVRVGQATDSEVTLEFNTSSIATGQKTYILIQ